MKGKLIFVAISLMLPVSAAFANGWSSENFGKAAQMVVTALQAPRLQLAADEIVASTIIKKDPDRALETFEKYNRMEVDAEPLDATLTVVERAKQDQLVIKVENMVALCDVAGKGGMSPHIRSRILEDLPQNEVGVEKLFKLYWFAVSKKEPESNANSDQRYLKAKHLFMSNVAKAWLMVDVAKSIPLVKAGIDSSLHFDDENAKAQSLTGWIQFAALDDETLYSTAAGELTKLTKSKDVELRSKAKLGLLIGESIRALGKDYYNPNTRAQIIAANGDFSFLSTPSDPSPIASRFKTLMPEILELASSTRSNDRNVAINISEFFARIQLKEEARKIWLVYQKSIDQDSEIEVYKCAFAPLRDHFDDSDALLRKSVAEFSPSFQKMNTFLGAMAQYGISLNSSQVEVVEGSIRDSQFQDLAKAILYCCLSMMAESENRSRLLDKFDAIVSKYPSLKWQILEQISFVMAPFDLGRTQIYLDKMIKSMPEDADRDQVGGEILKNLQAGLESFEKSGGS